MAQARHTDEQCQVAAALYEQYGSERAAAKASGLPRSTFQGHLKSAAERGMLGTEPVLPGFRITKTTAVTDKDGDVVREFVQQRPEAGEQFEVPAGHRIKGVSALVDPDGRELAKWIKTREDAFDPEAFVGWLKEAMTGYETRHEPVSLQAATSADILTLLPLPDLHLGLHAWGRETSQNWDLKIAENAIGSAIDDVVERSPASDLGVVLGGGDYFHSDNNENKTARSGNVLQVDGRYQKVVWAGCRLGARIVDASLRRHKHVIVRFLPGNHDEHAAVALAYFISAWYRNEPRVTVDLDPSLFWWHRFGSVMLGATHGHTVKIGNMPQIMAHRRAEDWGATKFRYIHGFHLHHTAKTMTEGGGCVTEVHQAPVPQDAWHFGAGFLSGRSLQSISYHREWGEIGRVRVSMMDAEAA